MATKKKSGKKKSARSRKSATRKGGAKRGSARKKSSGRKSASKAKGGKRRRSASRKRTKSPVARVKRVTKEVVQQATSAVSAGVETLKDLGGNIAERVPDRFKL